LGYYIPLAASRAKASISARFITTYLLKEYKQIHKLIYSLA